MKQALMLIACGSLCAAEPGLTVHIFNNAPVTADQIVRAEQAAGMVFGRIGIQVSWIDCRKEAWACESELAPNEVVVRILPRHPAVRSNDALGYAWEGGLATVYALDVADLAKKSGVDGSVLLGLVMAHELGHILLGSGHSLHGIMTARWQCGEFLAATQRGLVFTREEGNQLKVQIASLNRKALSTAAAGTPKRIP
jgi:hypothetical protein